MIIDLSSNNGTVDFAQITGVEEIFVRSSLGFGDFDKNLNVNASGAAANNIPVSYYHFAYPHSKVNPEDDAMKQANYFCDTIAKLPTPAHLAVDLENFSATSDTDIPKSNYEAWLNAFLNTVESRTGIRCIIYTYASYLNEHLPANHKFGDRNLWIANYSANLDPTLPVGWKSYWAWQYSETGKVPGITGNVDLSKTKP